MSSTRKVFIPKRPCYVGPQTPPTSSFRLSASDAMSHPKLASSDSDATMFSLAHSKRTQNVSAATESHSPVSSNTDTESPTKDNKPPPTTERTGRNLVLCFDGTGDQLCPTNSNIVRLLSLLKKGNSTEQMVYYQVRSSSHRLFFFFLGADVYACNLHFFKPGIGTYKPSPSATPFIVYQVSRNTSA